MKKFLSCNAVWLMMELLTLFVKENKALTQSFCQRARNKDDSKLLTVTKLVYDMQSTLINGV